MFTVEAWVKTTTTSGGKIVGFGNTPTGTSSSYDRHVYMDNAGHIIFGVYTGGVRTVTPARTYNDGQWHHVVGHARPAGHDAVRRRQQVGTNARHDQRPGLHRLLAGRRRQPSGWPSQPTSTYFTGDIDDVAIYPTALTLGAGPGPLHRQRPHARLPAAPADAYGKAVYDDDPDLYWRLDETSGTTAADATRERRRRHLLRTASPRPARRRPGTTATRPSRSTASTARSLVSSAFTNPTIYSEELWFKTSTTGGKLIGFGDNAERQLGQLRPPRLHAATTAAGLRHLDRPDQHHHHRRTATTTASGTTWWPPRAPTA